MQVVSRRRRLEKFNYEFNLHFSKELEIVLTTCHRFGESWNQRPGTRNAKDMTIYDIFPSHSEYRAKYESV